MDKTKFQKVTVLRRKDVRSWIQKFWEKHGSKMAWERKAVPCGAQETKRRNRKDMVPFPSDYTSWNTLSHKVSNLHK